MPTITLSDTTFAKVQAQAEPLVDDADAVVSRVFDFYAAHNGIAAKGNGRVSAASESPIRLRVGTRELTHTRLLSAIVDGVELHRPDWNSLARDMHEMAKRRLGSVDAVRKATSANLREGRFEENGYRYLPGVGFSIQGSDANNSCESSFRLAQAMAISLRVTFEWRDKEDAAHPGHAGVIEWSPTKHDADHSAEGNLQPWKETTRQAIQRVATNRPGRVFTLVELEARELARIVQETGSKGATPEATLRRICQELRDEGYIDFLDNDGTYRLR